MVAGKKKGVCVAVRVRPNGDALTLSENTITVEEKIYTFDWIFDTKTSQRDLTQFYADDPVAAFLHGGQNVSIVAYGQTASGKTHSMFGTDNDGIVFAVTDRILRDSQLDMCAFELYREKEYDLLANSACSLNVTECGVVGPTIHKIQTHADLVSEMKIILEARRIASTDMNDRSSRSHLFIQVKHPRANCSLTFVDLAGSERAGKTGCAGTQLKEGASINNSLMALSSVVSALSSGKRPATFRNSKLTRILRNSLARASNFYMILCCSNDATDLAETKQTLGFGVRAKNVQPVVLSGARKLDVVSAPVVDNKEARDNLRRLNFYRDRVSAQEQEIRNLVLRNRILRIRAVTVEQFLSSQDNDEEEGSD